MATTSMNLVIPLLCQLSSDYKESFLITHSFSFQNVWKWDFLIYTLQLTLLTLILHHILVNDYLVVAFQSIFI